MEQLLQMLQFLGVVLWPGGLIVIVSGFIAAAITIFVINSIERKQALLGAEDKVAGEQLWSSEEVLLCFISLRQ